MSKKSSKRRGCFLPLLLVLIVGAAALWLLWISSRRPSPASGSSPATGSSSTTWRDYLPTVQAPRILFPDLQPLPPPAATPEPQPAPVTPAAELTPPPPVRRSTPPPAATPPARRAPTPAATPRGTSTPAPVAQPTAQVAPSAPYPTSSAQPATPAYPSSSLGGQFFVVREKVARPSGYYLICTRDADADGNRYGFRVPDAEYNRASVGMLYDARNMREWQPVSRIE